MNATSSHVHPNVADIVVDAPSRRRSLHIECMWTRETGARSFIRNSQARSKLGCRSDDREFRSVRAAEARRRPNRGL